jgi:hypothetical protein
VASEEETDQNHNEKNPTVEYFASSKAIGIPTESVNELDGLTQGDIAFFDYEIKDIDGNIIYWN